MADRSYLQWPFFEERHRTFAAELDADAREFAFPHHVSEGDVDSACAAIASKLALANYFRNAVPREGAPLDVRTLCLTREMLARHSGLADFVFAMQGLGAGPISLFGTEAQRARYLSGVANGEMIAALLQSQRSPIWSAAFRRCWRCGGSEAVVSPRPAT
jgi:acyl-CoA dehydrogenase